MIVYVIQIGNKTISGITEDLNTELAKHKNAKVILKESYKSKKNAMIRLKQLRKVK